MGASAYVAAALLTALRFSIPEGATLNEFYRDGSVAAHLVARSGASPRIVFAFPAGNSGAAIWFESRGEPLRWMPAVQIEPASLESPQGRLNGVTAVLTGSGGPITVRQVVASNIRVIRDFDDSRAVPPEVVVAPQVAGSKVTWQRARLDGRGGYSLSVAIVDGEMEGGGAQPISFRPERNGRLRLRVTAATGDAPLTPIAEDEILTSSAAPDERLRQILAFLSYREKLLAGSWRFDTYFGRDTLMSLRLLSPVLKPELFEAGLGAVLARLNEEGEVAHEEDIGEFALLRRKQAGEALSDAPILDYKMIDDDFMLAIVAAHYLLDTPQGRARAAAFLAQKSNGGEKHGSALVRNFSFVVAAAMPFAREPAWRNLIALKSGQRVGNWRDSNEGLGGGRYPYDVNGVLVPAALDAIGQLHRSGLLGPYVGAEAGAGVGRAASFATIWRDKAPPLFDVNLTPAEAKSAVGAYGKAVAVNSSDAIAAIGSAPLRFRAVSLDDSGRPIRIQHSDESFALLFLDLSAEEAERIAMTLTRDFPAGLLTDVGLLVANPAFGPPAMWPSFDRNRYHGTVVWSWHHALLRAGLDRQLARDDLHASTRDKLSSARDRLLKAMTAATELRGSELWSWSASGDEFSIEPFGQAKGHETESNAAQLWSAVHLAWR